MKHDSVVLIVSVLFGIAAVICSNAHPYLRHALEIGCFICFLQGL